MDPNTRSLVMGAAGGATIERQYIEDAFTTFIYDGNGAQQLIRTGFPLASGLAIAPGDPLGGGYFAGFISETQNGVATHALIVAPFESGYNERGQLQWKTDNSSTAGTSSNIDGAANTAAMADAGHPAALYCANLSIGGFNDWYLPARYELEIAYYNLKPTTEVNSTSAGINPAAVPARSLNFTTTNPGKTGYANFAEGGAQAFLSLGHWSSTQFSSTNAYAILFFDGRQFTGDPKTNNFYVRAFRRIPINDPSLAQYSVEAKQGFTWIRARNGFDNWLVDTKRGSGSVLFSNSSASENGTGGTLSFQPTGVFLDTSLSPLNANNIRYASWNFRPAEKFFDIVTYTGNGTNRTIPHSLKSTPGCIIVKKVSSTGNWAVYHKSLPSPQSSFLLLNFINAVDNTTFNRWGTSGNVTINSEVFSVGTADDTNQNGATYVAYLFADSDSGGFGDFGEDSVVNCGTFEAGVSAVNVITGWEPQWVMFKASSRTGNWFIFDTNRGIATGGNDFAVTANSTAAESVSNRINLNTNGFQIPGSALDSGTYIFVAIRRGPMKKPTDATKVFAPVIYQSNGNVNRVIQYGFTTDAVISTVRNESTTRAIATRLTNTNALGISNTSAESTDRISGFDSQTGLRVGEFGEWNNVIVKSMINWAFRRAPSFFDVVTYTGGATGGVYNHNLGVTPEMIIVKCRSTAGERWVVYHIGLGAITSASNTSYIWLNESLAKGGFGAYSGYFTDAPTASSFTLGTDAAVNNSSRTYIAYLFASCLGVSKVGSYTGTGSVQNIDCGFTNGARFVLIKRTDSDSNWVVWDSARGITTGNDPYIGLNDSTAAEANFDVIDPLGIGFQLPAGSFANAINGQFIFLAIA